MDRKKNEYARWVMLDSARKEGREQGIEQGVSKGEQNVINLLKSGMSPQEILEKYEKG
jgi:hypothetical protein